MAVGTPGGTVHVRLNPDWQEQLGDQLAPAMRAAAEAMEQMAKGFVPVRTGRLRASITSGEFLQDSKIPAAVCWTAVPYGGWVEWGTGRRGAATWSRANVGLPAGYRHGPRPGMTARPYLRPALLSTLRQFTKLL